jgi:hypothetical protein
MSDKVLDFARGAIRHDDHLIPVIFQQNHSGVMWIPFIYRSQTGTNGCSIHHELP